MKDSKSKRDPAESHRSMLEDLLTDSRSLVDEIAENAKAVARASLGKLDVVSRDEFDGQVALLKRTRARIEQLESEMSALVTKIDELQNQLSK